MKISIVLPAHNEAGVIEKTVSSYLGTIEGKSDDYEIILVNDGSSDKTPAIINNLAENKNVRAIHRRPPNGFGLALREGFSAADGDIILPSMADLSDNPKDINKIVKEVKNGSDVVLGSRFIKRSIVKNYPALKLLFNRLFNNIFRLLYLSRFKDLTNAFKGYRREVLDSIKIKSEGFDITIEIALKAMIKGYSITSVPVSWRGREEGESKMKFYKVAKSYGTTLLKLWPAYVRSKLDY